MGSNTLNNITKGIIRQLHPNQFYSALIGNLLPRNSSGVPTDIAGSLGEVSKRWDNAYIKSLFIGATASGLSIVENSGLSFKVASSEKTRIPSTHRTVTTDGSDPGAGGIVTTAEQSDTETGTSYADMSGFSLTLTTLGRPVCIFMLGDSGIGGAGGRVGVTAVNVTDLQGYLKLVRDSTDVDEVLLEQTNDNIGASDSHEFFLPATSIMFFDFPAAGTYVYKLQGKVAASCSLELTTSRLGAMEIF